jgi:hypothetical protein
MGLFGSLLGGLTRNLFGAGARAAAALPLQGRQLKRLRN